MSLCVCEKERESAGACVCVCRCLCRVHISFQYLSPEHSFCILYKLCMASIKEKHGGGKVADNSRDIYRLLNFLPKAVSERPSPQQAIRKPHFQKLANPA